jgi:amino acid transporter
MASLRAEARTLGFLLVWAVVFADVGSSVYYTPGILYQRVGAHAALFVDLTFVVFVLLCIKYVEVAIRYPEGGGVVTVATHAIHPLAGLLGGLFILVDYFLTAGLSATSGVIYLSVIFKVLTPLILIASIAALIALGLLNLIGIKASAEVTAALAVLAAAGQLAVIVAVLARFGPAELWSSLPLMLTGPPLTPVRILTGYAGAFLAFSGLESISQLAPAIQEPRKQVARRAMTLVVLSLLVTSPLLTLWSTTLLKPGFDPNQGVSLLGGLAAGPSLQDAVAISGALLLVFACNTALIGCYHVFIALSRLRFLPRALQATNRWRRTPHWSIITATLVPMLIVIIAGASTEKLGGLFAFGLLGAFSITCLSLDIVRWHDMRKPRRRSPAGRVTMPMFVVGVATTVLVVIPWLTNLVAKPAATAFGGGLVAIGLGVAFVTRRLERRRGRYAIFPQLVRPGRPLVLLRRGRRLQSVAVMAFLPADPQRQADIISRAMAAARGRPATFVYQGQVPARRTSRAFEILDPYQDDRDAQAAFQQTEAVARKHRIRANYIYVPPDEEPDAPSRLIEELKPETLIAVA